MPYERVRHFWVLWRGMLANGGETEAVAGQIGRPEGWGYRVGKHKKLRGDKIRWQGKVRQDASSFKKKCCQTCIIFLFLD